MRAENLSDRNADKNYPTNDFHRFYFGEISRFC